MNFNFFIFSILIVLNSFSMDQQSRPDESKGPDNFDQIKRYMSMLSHGFLTSNADFVAGAIYQIKHISGAKSIQFDISKYKPTKEFLELVYAKISELKLKYNDRAIDLSKYQLEQKTISKNSKKKNKKNASNLNRQELNNKLFQACAHNDVDGIKEALAAGADIEAKRPDGRTPFLVAVSALAYHSVRLLVLEGANVNTQTNAGITALHIVAKKDYENNEDLSSWHQALIYLVLKLISKETLQKFTNSKGWHAVHIAAAYGNLTLVKILLDSEHCSPGLLTKKDHLSVYQIAQQFNQQEIMNYLKSLIIKK